jgi:hypothetical protein
VHAHVSNALRKTGCANRTELAVLAVQGAGAQYEIESRNGKNGSHGNVRRSLQRS